MTTNWRATHRRAERHYGGTAKQAGDFILPAPGALIDGTVAAIWKNKILVDWVELQQVLCRTRNSRQYRDFGVHTGWR